VWRADELSICRPPDYKRNIGGSIFMLLAMSTIYVVDDEVSIRNALRILLKVHGIAVKAYASAETFLVDAGHLRDGCLLLEINMRGLTGLELLKQLRSKNWHQPAVFMTSLVDGSLREKATQAGAFALLEKPFHADVLLSTMEQALIQHRSKADADTG
jgi:FixJ family two-component response regulator